MGRCLWLRHWRDPRTVSHRPCTDLGTYLHVGALPTGFDTLDLTDDQSSPASVVQDVQSFVADAGDTYLSADAIARQTWVEFFSLLLDGTAFGAAISLGLASLLTGWFYLTGYAGVVAIIFGAFSLLAASYYFGTGDSQPGALVFAIVTASIGSAFGLVGLSKSPTPATKTVSFVSAILGGAAAAIEISVH
jgi:hypothetical protein